MKETDDIREGKRMNKTDKRKIKMKKEVSVCERKRGEKQTRRQKNRRGREEERR
jgi:hypothetical protein